MGEAADRKVTEIDETRRQLEAGRWSGEGSPLLVRDAFTIAQSRTKGPESRPEAPGSRGWAPLAGSSPPPNHASASERTSDAYAGQGL